MFTRKFNHGGRNEKIGHRCPSVSWLYKKAKAVKIRGPMQIKSSAPCEIYRNLSKESEHSKGERARGRSSFVRVLFGGCFEKTRSHLNTI